MKEIWKSIKWGLLELVKRPIYIFAMIVVPIFGAYFFLNFLEEGLPVKVPTAVVDLDQTHMSRKLTQNLGDQQMVDIKYKYNDYTEAREAVQRGDIYGFYVIPRNFAKDALSGRQPQIAYYNNYVYYIPASISYKAYKVESTLASGALLTKALSATGAPQWMYMPKIQPFAIHVHQLNNPWTNYDIYLTNSFVPCLLALMVMIVTAYSIGTEIKKKTSVAWLQNSNGSVLLALIGKLLPQTIIFCVIGILLQSMCFGYYHFPLHCPAWHIILAMIFLVCASQSLALFIISIVPNLRIALSILSLTGILSFSIAGFSFPAEQMYPAIDIFTYILPIRHYFLINIDQTLNGIPLFYSRFNYIALLIFLFLPFTMLWNLKKSLLNPVYVP